MTIYLSDVMCLTYAYVRVFSMAFKVTFASEKIIGYIMLYINQKIYHKHQCFTMPLNVKRHLTKKIFPNKKKK